MFTLISSKCHTTSTIDIRYGLVPPCKSNIVNPIIPSKPMFCTIDMTLILLKLFFSLYINEWMKITGSLTQS